MAHTGTEITAELIRDLLREQHPDLAGRPVRLAALGWSNQVWRLGEDLAVRMPWMADGADQQLRNEYAWVAGLAAGLPLPVPVPQRLGEPSARFPRPWLVTTWVPGEPADRAPVTRGAESARVLGGFLKALHRPAPQGAPAGFGALPLAAKAEGFAGLFAQAVEQGLLAAGEPAAVRAVWEDALAAPVWGGPPVWQHGDLHAANVVTADGALSGVIDFGDVCAGDPACDLAALWTLLPAGTAPAFHRAYAAPYADAATLRRARGWALVRALAGLTIGEAGVHGRAGGKATWGPPARAALTRLLGAGG